MFTFRRLFRSNEIKCIYFFLVENSSHALSAQLMPPTECVTKQMNMSENRTALPKGNGNIEKQVKCLRSRAGDERVVQAAAPTSLGQKLQMMKDKKNKNKTSVIMLSSLNPTIHPGPFCHQPDLDVTQKSLMQTREDGRRRRRRQRRQRRQSQSY